VKAPKVKAFGGRTFEDKKGNAMPNEHSNQAPGQNKTYDIVVNGRQKTVTTHKLTYADVVKLAFPADPPDDAVVYTVTFANPHGHDGTLAAGQDVPVKDGMVFNVSKTNRS
jgi:hypothetical protein